MFFEITQQFFALLSRVNFPANNLNFHWRWWDQIQAIFSNLFYCTSSVNCNEKIQGHRYSKFLLFLFQEYHAEIDKLKSELQSARDKDGVFLPKDHYEEQIKAKEWADKEIHEKGLLLKALEEELQKFKVGHFLSS